MFWAKVRITGFDECWEWAATLDKNGYGLFWLGGGKGGKNGLAHRVAWEFVHGCEIPNRLHVLHRCDNPSCVNPAHLFLGTQSDNMADCVAKGRHVHQIFRGEDHPMAKMSWREVETIRYLYREGLMNMPAIGSRFGITKTTVRDIVRNRTWIPQEIEEPPVMPNDMSKVSDEVLHGLHARFHAVSSRVIWVLAGHESELRDVVKLRKGREVQVANSLPATIDRKRVTDDQRKAMVAEDEQVRAYLDREHEVEKVIRKLGALRDNYLRDVAVCSRQWTFRHGEQEAAGGLRR